MLDRAGLCLPGSLGFRCRRSEPQRPSQRPSKRQNQRPPRGPAGSAETHRQATHGTDLQPVRGGVQVQVPAGRAQSRPRGSKKTEGRREEGGHREEEVHLRGVQDDLLEQAEPPSAPPRPRRPEAFPVLGLREGVLVGDKPENARVAPHGCEALQVRGVRESVCSETLPGQPHAAPPHQVEAFFLSVRCEAKASLRGQPVTDTRGFTFEEYPFVFIA